MAETFALGEVVRQDRPLKNLPAGLWSWHKMGEATAAVGGDEINLTFTFRASQSREPLYVAITSLAMRSNNTSAGLCSVYSANNEWAELDTFDHQRQVAETRDDGSTTFALVVPPSDPVYLGRLEGTQVGTVTCMNDENTLAKKYRFMARGLASSEPFAIPRWFSL